MSYDIKFKQRAVEYQREGHTYKARVPVIQISSNRRYSTMVSVRDFQSFDEGSIPSICS